MADKSPTQQIDDIIRMHGDWRGSTLSQLRMVITQTSPQIIEEVKWKKPSRPEGVPVWSHDGIICVADVLKSAVRLTFFKGAQCKNVSLFNTRMDSKTVRAIDFHENDSIDEGRLRKLIIEAIGLNSPKTP